MAKSASLLVFLLSTPFPGGRVSEREKGERDNIKAPTDRIPQEANESPSFLCKSHCEVLAQVSSLLGTWGHPASPKWLSLFFSQSPRVSMGKSRWDLLLLVVWSISPIESGLLCPFARSPVLHLSPDASEYFFRLTVSGTTLLSLCAPGAC